MNIRRIAAQAALLAAGFVQAACAPAEPPAGGEGQGTKPALTNRLHVPPEVASNLGITFVAATRGLLGVWEEVPGELEVPEHRRWTVRAPVEARVVAVVPRWQVVAAGAEIAVLASPALRTAGRAIELAERTCTRATAEVAAARARLAESEAHLEEAKSFEAASRDRLHELEALAEQGNALSAREIIEARRTVTEAGKASLDAAIVRDDLLARVASREIEAEQARLAVDQEVSALSMMTGLSAAALAESDEAGPGWRRLDTLVLRAPAAGTVVELLVAAGEFVQTGVPIARVVDTSELRFRGHLPEGDLGELAAGDRVRIELPSGRLAPIESEVEALLPLADEVTRMIHVTARVANPGGALPHGISVTARVRIRAGEAEEVLIPARCVVQDGLEAIVFKRDPGEPTVVVRTPVELGARAAGQVEVLAGVLDGDEVVADGVQQLKQSGLGRAPEGGHFHADGTWHRDHE